MDEKIGDIVAGEDTATQTAGGIFSTVGILEGNDKNEFQRKDTPTTAEAAMIAARTEYDAAMVESVSTQL